jgi:hypothetical protein
MTWTVNTTERFGGANRAPRINPYLPARTESLDGNGSTFSYKDIGKPVVLYGDRVRAAVSGQEIYGFIESVEAATQGGYGVGGVLCDVGQDVLAVDQAGDLVVGDLVVAGTATAVGTQTPALGANVIRADQESSEYVPYVVHRWMVLAYYGVKGAGKQVMLRKV